MSHEPPEYLASLSHISIPALRERVDTAGEIPDVFVALSVGEYEALVEAVEEYQALNDWVTRMPDAGFNDQDPRWGWWHQRPKAAALARFDFGGTDG